MNQENIANRPLIIGHRGAKGEAPENTLASFELGLQQGADAFELDIHVTADGQLVVCHDETLDRTTNIQGTIASMTAEEVQRADAGLWFHERFRGERVPLLSEVFDLVPGSIMINIEVKCPYSPVLSEQLKQLLIQYDRFENTVISSFSHKTLHKLKKDVPALRIGLLYVEELVSHDRLADIADMEIYSLHPRFLSIDAEDVAAARRRGLYVYPWTVNETSDLEALTRMGCSGIITDFPGRLKQLLG